MLNRRENDSYDGPTGRLSESITMIFFVDPL